MATIQLPYEIASISGKIGNVVFYHQNGKQYARRLSKTQPMGSPEEIIDLLRGERRHVRPIVERESSHSRAIVGSAQPE